MAQRLLIIYRAVSTPPQQITVAYSGNAFVSGAGNWDQVCRVDLYSASDQTVLAAVVGCDPATSIVTVDLSGGTFVELGLAFTYLLGTPKPVSGFTRGVDARLEIQNIGGADVPVFRGGMRLNARQVKESDGVTVIEDYSDVFARLEVLDSVTDAVDSSPLPSLPDAWHTFAFDSQISYQIRNLNATGQATLVPVLTIERNIPAIQNSVLRRLPPPFDIPFAQNSSSLRAVQFPSPDWIGNPAGPATDWIIDVSGFQSGAISSFWQHSVVDRYIGAMQSVSDVELVSLLPNFTGPQNDSDWRLQFPVNSKPAPEPGGPASLQFLGPLESWPPPAAPVQMSCPGFLTYAGLGLSFSAQLKNSYLPDSTVPSMRFSLAGVAFQGGDDGTRIRLGSLDLSLKTPPVNLVWMTCGITFDQVTSYFWLPRVSLSGQVPLSAIAPGGQDDPNDPQFAEVVAALEAAGQDPNAPLALSALFAREPALLVPVVSSQNSGPPSPQVLTANLRESSVKGQDQQFTLIVESGDTGDGAPNNVLVIDRNPFMVALAQLPNLASTASADTGQIAQWSNSFPEGAGWRISAGAASFQLVLPPQGVGEAMVTGQISGEPTDGIPVDFRFTPVTQAVLEPSGQVQLFAEPGWNLRRLLGYPGERAPGAAVDSVQTESAYGLVCNISTSGLQLSEMFSRLGGFAGPLVDAASGSIALTPLAGYTKAQIDRFDDLNQQWGALYNQLLSRLGIFELWNQERDFDLLLTEDVSYDLRSETQPLLDGGVAYALKNAVSPQIPDVFAAVEQNPHSSSAALMNPRFSALGAYGRQRAAFAHDNVIVETDIAMGLLDSMSVTVIGRVGNLWHHAKHVVVFERSVRPSRQFYMEQPLLDGRPIMRKVSEYIEIVQKSRSYPEVGPPVSCGFVQGAEFKSIRINVDGNWATKVGATGFKIPLWRRDAAPSDVYPRPHVLLQFATDPATGSDSAMSEILNPDKLFFYADPSQTTSNTDIWPAIDTVDFCINTPYRSIGDNPLGADYSAELGFGAFTYSVAGDANQVNVVSQRTPKAISSALQTVSFMRAQNNAPVPTPIQQGAGRLHDFVNNTLDELVKAAQSDTTHPAAAINARLTAITGDLVKPFKDACSTVSGANLSSICAVLGTAASNAVQQAAEPVGQVWQSMLSKAESQLISTANSAQPTAASLQQAVLGGVDNAYLGMKSVVGVLLSDLSVAKSLENRLTSLCTSIINDLASLEATITDANLANLSFRQACAVTLGRCQGDLNVILDDIQLLMSSADFMLGVRATSLGSMVDAKSALADFCQELAEDFSALLQIVPDTTKHAADINGEIDQIKTLLGLTDLQNALTALGNALSTLSAMANPLLAYLIQLRDKLHAAIQQVSTTAPADFIQAITQTFSQTVLPNYQAVIDSLAALVQNQVSAVCNVVLNNFKNSLLQEISGFLDSSTITAALTNCQSVSDFVDALEDLRTGYTAQLDGVVQQVMDTYVSPVATSATTTGLSLLRAFGAPPIVPGLDFGETDAIAYFYNTVKQQAGAVVSEIVQDVPVSADLQSFVTQASSAVGDATNALQQLGIGNLPVQSILDRLIPPDLSKLQLSDIFPNVAGLDLANLFSGVTMPQFSNNNIQISHNVDPQSLRASLDVTINMPLDSGSTTLFSIGPVTITIENCVFQAAVHVAGGPGQSGSRTSSGSISGDWNVLIGGTEIVSFVSTSLSFDESGHLHFDIAPPRVRLAAVLQFLASFVEDLDLGGGFTLNLLPTGIQCLLDLPFPDMSAGAFGISNLSLGCSFELDILPEFQIIVGANLGQQEAPFTLTIFILGGAGWFESNVTYTPSTGKLAADVSIGILASASLSISLGPISGGVFIYFGITAEYHTSGGLDLGILIMIQGRVSLLGIIDADITLLLEAEYTSDDGLIGRGEVDVSIKICWCFTLEVHKSVEFTFGSAGKSPALAPSTLLSRSATALTAASDPTLSYAQAATSRINFLT